MESYSKIIYRKARLLYEQSENLRNIRIEYTLAGEAGGIKGRSGMEIQ